MSRSRAKACRVANRSGSWIALAACGKREPLQHHSDHVSDLKALSALDWKVVVSPNDARHAGRVAVRPSAHHPTSLAECLSLCAARPASRVDPHKTSIRISAAFFASFYRLGLVDQCIN